MPWATPAMANKKNWSMNVEGSYASELVFIGVIGYDFEPLHKTALAMLHNKS